MSLTWQAGQRCWAVHWTEMSEDRRRTRKDRKTLASETILKPPSTSTPGSARTWTGTGVCAFFIEPTSCYYKNALGIRMFFEDWKCFRAVTQTSNINFYTHTAWADFMGRFCKQWILDLWPCAGLSVSNRHCLSALITNRWLCSNVWTTRSVLFGLI